MTASPVAFGNGTQIKIFVPGRMVQRHHYAVARVPPCKDGLVLGLQPSAHEITVAPLTNVQAAKPQPFPVESAGISGAVFVVLFVAVGFDGVARLDHGFEVQFVDLLGGAAGKLVVDERTETLLVQRTKTKLQGLGVGIPMVPDIVHSGQPDQCRFGNFELVKILLS